MSDEQTDLTAFTRALAGVAPHPGQLNRDSLLFAAGLAAGRRRRFWPLLCAGLALTSLGLGLALFLRPRAVVEVVRIIEVQRPAPVPEVVPPAPSSDLETQPLTSAPSPEWTVGLELRERVLRDSEANLAPVAWPAPAPPRAPDRHSDLFNLRKDVFLSTGD